MTDFTFEFATRDDCLDVMVPSDLRGIIAERDRLRAQLDKVNTVITKLDTTISDKQQLVQDWMNDRWLGDTGAQLAREASLKFLRINIDELNYIRDELVTAKGA